MPIHLVLFLVLSLFSASAQDVYYVRPDESPPAACPGQPCLTLDQYTQQAETYFITGATFLFLPGNHSLQTQVNLTVTDCSNITLRGSSKNTVDQVIYSINENVGFYLINVTNVIIEQLTFMLFPGSSSILNLRHCKSFLISDSIFQGKGKLNKTDTRALYATSSEITIINTLFEENTGVGGGAMYASKTAVTLFNCIFRRNRAIFHGGAIYARGSNLTIVSTNKKIIDPELFVASPGATVFYHNEARGLCSLRDVYYSGKGGGGGGSITCLSCNILFNGTVEFVNNKAKCGGAMYLDRCNFTAIHLLNFTNNSANFGGAVVYFGSGHFFRLKVTHVIASGNNGSAFHIISSNSVIFDGNVSLISNTGTLGGSMHVEDSILTFGYIEFSCNTAEYGGAIYSTSSHITFQRKGLFENNRATNGGAIHLTNTEIVVKERVECISNSAKNGGAAYFVSGGLTLDNHEKVENTLLTYNNTAEEYGGAVYYEDAPTPIQCSTTLMAINDDFFKLPQCFVQICDNTQLQDISQFDSAGKEGDFVYGGLIDRCRLKTELSCNLDFNEIRPQLGNIITSKPYKLSICNITCTSDQEHEQVVVHRGQEFRLFMVALDQMCNPVSTNVTAITSHSARLEKNQSTQHLPSDCSSPLIYKIYSNTSEEQLVLYPDGPCRDTGTARVLINITLLPCPDGFNQSNGKCICEQRLQVYDVECTIDDNVYMITRNIGSKFWMSGLYENGNFLGVILCETCPFEYCTDNTVNLTLNNSDTQCAHNRGGMLCGQCTADYSLTLGSDHCQVCSNAYLALLLPFAAAGVALVVFLTFLRLTVATGMINSVILYANIVQVNRKMFFTSGKRNILTVFLAWMNLDLGFKTCFYDGMDAYAQTWLQFAFPVYVWTLITLILVSSRYSILVSKLIGSNPVAVLATLLLMSYTKILKIVIEVYSPVKLDYPDNKTNVWLRDANVPYLQSKHLLLTVVTSLVLVFLFLPYTLLLLFGHKLYRFTGRKGFRWFSKIRPLLDSYYAPYKMHTRYWTGLLLLVRCVLYMLFSYNSLGATNKSLLAIITTFTVITVVSGYLFGGKIYDSFYINVIEVASYQNLILLSAATLAGVNSPALVYTLVGTVFATMIGITVYHFHLLYTAKSAIWLKVKVMLGSALAAVKNHTVHRDIQQPAPVETGVRAKAGSVSKTVIELREPLLEDN